MAQLAVAAAVGSLFGAPQVGWLVGSFIGGQLIGGQGGKVEGPRLGDLQVQASTYGMGIPQIYGSMRIAGNVIWEKPLIEKRQKESAGKGGGGPTVVSYSYYATFAVAFARGPIGAIRRVWADGKLLVDLSETAPQGKTYRYGERIYRLHLGAEDQQPDPVIEMHEGAGTAPAYRGLAYITFDELPLEDLGNRIPNITAEILADAETTHPTQHVDLGGQGIGTYGKAGWRLDASFEKNGAGGTIGGGVLTVRQGTSGYTNNDFTAGTAVLPVTAGDYFELRVNSTSSSWDDIQAGIRTWFAVEVVETADAANPPYEFPWRKEGQPGVGEAALRQVLARKVRLEADFAGNVGSAGTAATADADFDVRRNGGSIGTIRFGVGATAPTFIAAAAVTLEVGDELTILAPASVDASLAELAVTLVGNLIS